ncbi:DUF465 domain-containing protein [bacterium]|nr:DUF465 domain-containing protein [bacterium]
MIQNRDITRKQLIDNDPIFRQMIEDHRSLNDAADSLSKHQVLTQNEAEQLHKLKRKKLLIRDRIEKRLLTALEKSQT